MAWVILAIAAPVHAQSEFTRHALTVALVEKHQAAARELEKKVKQALASYPPEMRANIELLRKNPQLLK